MKPTSDYSIPKYFYTRGLLPHNNLRGFLLMFLWAISATSLAGCSRVANQIQAPLPDGQGITETEPTTVPNVAPPPIIASSGNPNYVVEVVQRVGPAVVRIDSSRTVSSRGSEEFEDPFFRRFFSDGQPRQRERVERGSGSGFIINRNGQILTNAHVVDGADVVTVVLKDGRSFDGKVVGEDSVTDVAVIKIDANNLPVVPIGNSENLQVGEAVVAIGNPLGLDYTVTSGIISATERSSRAIGATDKRVDYLQTDAAINPGNSGGPLLNARGEVIGMNTAIIRGAQGLGFAIPINTAQRISEQLITKGRVDHPYLGIQMATLTPEIRQRLTSKLGVKLSADKGVLLVDIVPRSPAADAGLRQGDLILRINNQSVTKIEEVQRLVENSQIGNPLQIQVERNGQITQVAVKPQPLPAQRQS
jgi:serine protease Do